MSYLLYKSLSLSNYSEEMQVLLEWLENDVGLRKNSINKMKALAEDHDDVWQQQFMHMQVFSNYRCGHNAAAIMNTTGDGWEMYQAWCRSDVKTEIQIFVRVDDDALAVKMKLELFSG